MSFIDVRIEILHEVIVACALIDERIEVGFVDACDFQIRAGERTVAYVVTIRAGMLRPHFVCKPRQPRISAPKHLTAGSRRRLRQVGYRDMVHAGIVPKRRICRRAGAHRGPQKPPRVDTVDFLEQDGEYARTYDAGAVVFNVNDPADCLYVVLYGVIEIRLDAVVLERVQPGGVLGEMALIEELPRSATAVALEETRLSIVDKERFLFLVQHQPYFALQVMEVLARRLRKMDETLRKNVSSNKR